MIGEKWAICSITPEEAECLNDHMDDFIVRQVGFVGSAEIGQNYAIKDDGTIIAGIRACFYLARCLVITLLFVDEAYRHKGLGRALLEKVETEAKALGATLAHLDTFDFQAKDFYLKQGYEVFGVLEDCPPGHKRYYLKKVL